MRKVSLFAFLLPCLTLASAVQVTEERQPTESKQPLSLDQIAIYHTFLKHYDNGGKGPLHVAKRTEALVEPEPGESDDLGAASCLTRLKIRVDEQAIGVFHLLDATLSTPGRIELVDPDQQATAIKANDPSKTMSEGKTAEEAVDNAFSTGLLTLSEIAFDRKHRVAVMSFSFSCGRLCGHGAIIVFRKTRKGWKLSHEVCAGWVS